MAVTKLNIEYFSSQEEDKAQDLSISRPETPQTSPPGGLITPTGLSDITTPTGYLFLIHLKNKNDLDQIVLNHTPKYIRFH